MKFRFLLEAAAVTGDYIERDGSTELTANWDAGAFEIRAETFESDVTTGTAPFTIASTTLVSNLNADLLDSQEGSYYLDSANFTGTNWTDLTDAGETALHTHAAATPAAHKDSHDPQDGSDALDTAAPAELAAVQAAGTGTSHSLARADHAHQVQHAITNNHLVTIDGTTNQPVDGDYAKFTALGLEGMSKAQILSDINVADGADVTGSNAPQAHTASHTDGTDDIQSATNAQKGVATAAQITALEATLPSIDEDAMGSDSAAHCPTQQSVKAYVDGAHPAFHAIGDTDQDGIANVTWDQVEFNDKTTAPAFDTHGYYDTTNFRYKPLKAGKYLFYAGLFIENLDDRNFCMVGFDKTGAATYPWRYRVYSSGTNQDPGQILTAIIDMDGVNDYVEVWGYHDNGAADVNFAVATSVLSFFGGVRVSS